MKKRIRKKFGIGEFIPFVLTLKVSNFPELSTDPDRYDAVDAVIHKLNDRYMVEEVNTEKITVKACDFHTCKCGFYRPGLGHPFTLADIADIIASFESVGVTVKNWTHDRDRQYRFWDHPRSGPAA